MDTQPPSIHIYIWVVCVCVCTVVFAQCHTDYRIVPLTSLVFWELTNCSRTEIELGSWTCSRNQTPCCFYFSHFYACCDKSADAEWICHISNSLESPKSSQLWNVKYLGLDVILHFIFVTSPACTHPNISPPCGVPDIISFCAFYHFSPLSYFQPQWKNRRAKMRDPSVHCWTLQ